MSNTIAHLALARRILEMKPDLAQDHAAYYLGSLAPDTIGSKPGCTRDDKKQVHLRQEIRDADWLNADKMQIFSDRIRQFVQEHILSSAVSIRQRDFNLGYLVHLLTDKWNHKTIRQTMLKIANERGIQESDRDFFHMITNDLEALDHYLLRAHPDLYTLFLQVTGTPVPYGLPGYIEPAYIDGSIRWWQDHYLPSIRSRRLLYITEGDINEFLAIAAQEIIKELSLLL